MSWDIYLVPAEHADDAPEWLESLVGEPADGAAAAGHAAAIRVRRPELEPFEAEEGIVELSAPEESELPLQVFLDGRHAAVSVAYWDLGERTPELAELVVDVVDALMRHTGWMPYDPQEDRVVHPEELRATFLGGHEHGVGLVRELGAPEPHAETSRRRRFFGLFGG